MEETTKKDWIVSFEDFESIKNKLYSMKNLGIFYISTAKKVYIRAYEKDIKDLSKLNMIKYEPSSKCGISLN